MIVLSDFINKKYNALNEFLQSHLGFSLNYLTNHGSWILSREIIVSLLSFINVILLTRYFSRETYGQFLFVNATVELIKITALPGIFTAVARSIARGFDGSLLQGFKTKFSYSLIGVLILWGVTGYYYWIDDLLLCKAFFIVSIFFPFVDSLKLWMAFLVGKEKFASEAQKTIIISVGTTLTFLAASFLDFDLIFLVATSYAITTGLYFVFFYQVKKTVSNSLVTKETIIYGWFLTKIRWLGVLIYQIDKVIIGAVSVEILSVFGLAQRMTEVIETVLSGPLKITFPKFVNQDTKQISNKVIIVLFIIGLLVSIPLIFLAKFIILSIFTDKYLDSVSTFQVLSIAIPFVFVASIYKQKIGAQKKEKALLQLNFSIPLLSLFFAGVIYFYTSSFYYFFFAKILSLKIMEAIYLAYFDKYSNKE